MNDDFYRIFVFSVRAVLVEETPATGLEETVNAVDNTTKYLRDGKLLITRDGKTYNVQGMRVE